MEEVKKLKKFSMEGAIEFAWEITKKNFWFLFGVMMTILVVSAISQWAGSMRDSNGVGEEATRGLGFVLGVISWFLSMVISIGFVKIAIKFVKGETPIYNDLFSCVNLFFKYFFSAILYGFVVIGGCILLIVPGVIWAIKYQFFPYFILQGDGPIVALKKSAKITYGSKWDLFIFGILLFVIELIGLLALFIGLLWAIPVVAIARAFVFIKLSEGVDFSDILVKKTKEVIVEDKKEEIK